MNTPSNEEYEERVQALEDEGCTRSDAQGVVDAEIMQASRPNRDRIDDALAVLSAALDDVINESKGKDSDLLALRIENSTVLAEIFHLRKACDLMATIMEKQAPFIDSAAKALYAGCLAAAKLQEKTDNQ